MGDGDARAPTTDRLTASKHEAEAAVAHAGLDEQAPDPELLDLEAEDFGPGDRLVCVAIWRAVYARRMSTPGSTMLEAAIASSVLRVRRRGQSGVGRGVEQLPHRCA